MDAEATESFERLTECDICSENFHSTNRKPKTLSCGHTFCVICLEKLLSEHVVHCPMCKQMSPVKTCAKDLPTNYSSLSLLEKLCEVCRRRSWIGRCGHCTKNVCPDCEKEHSNNAGLDIVSELQRVKKKVMDIQNNCDDDAGISAIDHQASDVIAKINATFDKAAEKLEIQRQETILEVKKQAKIDKQELVTWRGKAQSQITTKKGFMDETSLKISQRDTLKIKLEDIATMSGQCQEAVRALEDAQSSMPVASQIEYKPNPDLSLPLMGELKIKKPNSEGDESASKKPVLLPDYSANRFLTTCGKQGSGPGEFNWPMGVAASPIDGNIVVTDFCNNKIHILTKRLDTISTFGSGGSGDGQFQCPFGVAINNDNTIFISDHSNHRIQVMDGYGSYLYKFGSLGSERGQYNSPRGIAFDDDGLLYICDCNNYRIQVVNSDGSFVREFGSRGKGPGQFSAAICVVAVSKQNTVVVADTGGTVYIFTTTGEHINTLTIYTRPLNMFARGLVIDEEQNIIITNEKSVLAVMRVDGEEVCFIGSQGKGPGQLSAPAGLALTPEGNILVCDAGNYRIQLIEVPKGVHKSRITNNEA